MVKMTNICLRLKEKIKNKATNVKINLKNSVQKFQENFAAAKNKPRLKRQSFLLGAATVLGIFGVTLFMPVLSAIADDFSIKFSRSIPPDGIPTEYPFNNEPLKDKVCKWVSNATEYIGSKFIQPGSFIFGLGFGLIIIIIVLNGKEK